MHCKLHPVIHIDFGGVCGSSYAEVKKGLSLAVNKAFKEHEYLVQKTDNGLIWASKNLTNEGSDISIFEVLIDERKCLEASQFFLEYSLRFLSELLHKHYRRKVFILIDDYDALVLSLIFDHWNNNDVDLVDDLVKSFTSYTFLSNDALNRSLIFACLHLVKHFATKNIAHYSFTLRLPFAKYFGFTTEEVEELLQRPKIKDFCCDLEKIREWFDGYVVDCEKIYSNWSILNHLVNSETRYWTDIGHVENIKGLFEHPLIRQKIEQVIPIGNQIILKRVQEVTLDHIMTLKELIHEFVESHESVNLFFHFLADCGYFNTKHDKRGDIFKVPNFEIRKHLMEMCYSKALNIVFEYNLRLVDIQTYIIALKSILDTTSEGEFINFAKAVLALFSAPARMPTNENELLNVLHILAYDSRYFVAHSNIYLKENKEGQGEVITVATIDDTRAKGIIFEYLMYFRSTERNLELILEELTVCVDIPIKTIIYAVLVFDTVEKIVSIGFKVGKNDKINFVSSHTE